MPLPKTNLRTGSVTINDEIVEFRALSRAEVLLIADMEGRLEDVELLALTAGVGVTEEEAREWRAATDATTAGILLDAIMELSGVAMPELLVCPECGHEARLDAFTPPEDETPKGSRRSRRMKGR